MYEKPTIHPIKWPAPGRYVLAVSGGADSMTLLHIFARAAVEQNYHLLVAHFDHGLRPDSGQDRHFVQAAAERYRLPFLYQEARLEHASEAVARAARHAWLEHQRLNHHAAAVITAHHQDDLIETSLLNLARGSGRLGLAPMVAPNGPSAILRPLLNYSRADLQAYAARHRLTWREDSTNADLTNPRNFLRHRLLPAAGVDWRRHYLDAITELAALNDAIALQLDTTLATLRTKSDTFTFPRPLLQTFTPDETVELLLAAARRLRPGLQLDQPLLRELTTFARTGASHKFRPLRRGLTLALTREAAILSTKAPQ